MNRSPEDEYAEAFRRGYERARRGFEPTVAIDRDELTSLDDLLTFPSDDEVEPSYRDRTPPAERHRRRRPSTRLVGGVALALSLVLGAFVVGRLAAGSGTDADGAGSSGRVAAAGESGGPDANSGQEPYGGAVAAVEVQGAEATCQSAPSVDAAGNPVTYEPAQAHDADLSTAWRCDGSGAGQRMTLSLPAGTKVAEVGLVPGYAKTDPVSGVDRYAENNRITRVRWHFADGTRVLQEIDADPSDRSMRTMRVPVTESGSVVLEILESMPGARDTVAISEVRVASATG